MISVEHPGAIWRDPDGMWSICEHLGSIQRHPDDKLNPTCPHLGGIWQHLAGLGTHQGHQIYLLGYLGTTIDGWRKQSNTL